MKSKIYTYYVVARYEKKGEVGTFGVEVKSALPLKEYNSVEKLSDEIRKKGKYRQVVILNWILLNKATTNLP